jgi:membrane protein DedA with SNARE-associated domain
MTELDSIIGVILTLFIVFLLGYVFVLVFWELSPLLAVLFILAMAIIVIGILFGILRRE